MDANLQSKQSAAREGYIAVENAELYVREIGQGEPIIILHGGPDFDQNYFLPEMDLLADAFRLIYYDQRGRGKSARHVKPEDVTMQSEMEDLEGVREYFQLQSIALLGHSWGGVLAMEYAIRHPERVSHLILMNTAPASGDDCMNFRQQRQQRWADDLAKMKAIAATAKYEEGDPETVAAYYRIHFSATLRQVEHLEQVIQRLRAGFTNEAILKSRAIEDRLMDETWLASEYDLLPKLKQFDIPTLVIHGDYDFIPIEYAAHVAEAIPAARFVVLKETGHFSYLESPNQVRQEIAAFFAGI